MASTYYIHTTAKDEKHFMHAKRGKSEGKQMAVALIEPLTIFHDRDLHFIESNAPLFRDYNPELPDLYSKICSHQQISGKIQIYLLVWKPQK